MDAPCTRKGSQTGRGKLPAFARVQAQNKKVRAETLSELETGCADPVDQHLSDVTLAARGEDRGVMRVVVNHQQEVTLGTGDVTRTSTPTPVTTSVPVTKLLGGRGLATALLLLARTTTGTTPLRRAATSTTAASATSASATSASAASTAATDASTPATTPTTTPAPSTASTTTTSTAPASPTGTSAPLALAGAASPARGRRSADRLETTEAGQSSRGNRG
ncbi:unnamed protein product [Closterium sp. NIES-54]